MDAQTKRTRTRNSLVGLENHVANQHAALRVLQNIRSLANVM
jgi:hypothetical protein